MLETTKGTETRQKCYAHKSRPAHRQTTTRRKKTKRATQMANRKKIKIKKNDRNFTASQLWPGLVGPKWIAGWSNRGMRIGNRFRFGSPRDQTTATETKQQTHKAKAKVVTVFHGCCSCCFCCLCCNQNAHFPCDWQKEKKTWPKEKEGNEADQIDILTD